MPTKEREAVDTPIAESNRFDESIALWKFRLNSILLGTRDPLMTSYVRSLLAAHDRHPVTRENAYQSILQSQALRLLGQTGYRSAEEVEDLLGEVPQTVRLFPYNVPLMNAQHTRCGLGVVGMVNLCDQARQIRYGYVELATGAAGTKAHFTGYFGTADRLYEGYDVVGNIQRLKPQDCDNLCQWVLDGECSFEEMLRAASLPGNQ